MLLRTSLPQYLGALGILASLGPARRAIQAPFARRPFLGENYESRICAPSRRHSGLRRKGHLEFVDRPAHEGFSRSSP